MSTFPHPPPFFCSFILFVFQLTSDTILIPFQFRAPTSSTIRLISVRTAGLHVDGAPEAGWFVLLPPRPVREARRRVQHHVARRHHNGLPERVLRPPAPAGLLRRPVVADGARHHDEDDTAGADLGSEGDLHTGLVSEGRGSGEGQDERGGGLFRARCAKLRRQNGGGELWL